MTRRSIAAVLLCVLGLGPVVRAEDQVLLDFQPDVVSDIPLDGLLDETRARRAPALRVDPVEVPDGRGGRVSLDVEVAAVIVDGALRVAVIAPEPPGLGMGLAMMVAEEGTKTAADAVAISYAPQDVRAPRLVVRGPRGLGRSVYRVEAAAAIGLGDRWGVEVQVPLADLGLSSPDARLRLAVAVRTRAPRLVTWAPPGAAFRGPGTWIPLAPPAAGWPITAAGAPDGEALAAEDAADGLRLDAWNRFLMANQSSIDALVTAANLEGGALEASDDAIRTVALDALAKPLLDAASHRPDLAMLHVVRGHVLTVLGLGSDARAAYEQALDVVPGLVEARYGLTVGLAASARAAAALGTTTDFEQALTAAGRAAEGLEAGFARDATDFGRGLLLYLRGDFASAAPLLDPLAARYPFSQSLVFTAERNRSAVTWWARELAYRTRLEKRGGPPRARLKTTKGEIVLGLLLEDAPNTVDNFVWLAKHGFYDDAPVATVPFFAVRVAEGRDPGYAIPTELPSVEATWRPGARRDVRKRRPFRGTAVLLSPKPDSGAGTFALFTGSALHLEDEYVAFGRILEGLEVLDALTGEDRILGVTVEPPGRPGLEGWGGERRPITVDGTPAPVPTPR